MGEYSLFENIDYSKTCKSSVWGSDDKDTLKLIDKTSFNGKWLNLAAGDGRYNTLLLTKADQIIASDIDEKALKKLYKKTPKNLLNKLKIQTLDINQFFPFEDEYFDGVFCTGTLHLFSEDQLRNILSEINRVLKAKGKIFIDFATDVKRVLPNGKDYSGESKEKYSQKETKILLKKLLSDYKIKIIESKVSEEKIKIGKLTYKFSCNFIILTGEKLK